MLYIAMIACTRQRWTAFENNLRCSGNKRNHCSNLAYAFAQVVNNISLNRRESCENRGLKKKSGWHKSGAYNTCACKTTPCIQTHPNRGCRIRIDPINAFTVVLGPVCLPDAESACVSRGEPESCFRKKRISSLSVQNTATPVAIISNNNKKEFGLIKYIRTS
jgi:hypothetical protein